MVKLKNLLTELEFKTPEDFKKYKAKHKMRPGTVVKVAGKDKVVGGDDESKASPKKRFSDIPFMHADVGEIKKFAKDNNLEINDMSRDPNGSISVYFHHLYRFLFLVLLYLLRLVGLLRKSLM